MGVVEMGDIIGWGRPDKDDDWERKEEEKVGYNPDHEYAPPAMLPKKRLINVDIDNEKEEIYVLKNWDSLGLEKIQDVKIDKLGGYALKVRGPVKGKNGAYTSVNLSKEDDLLIYLNGYRVKEHNLDRKRGVLEITLGRETEVDAGELEESGDIGEIGEAEEEGEVGEAEEDEESIEIIEDLPPIVGDCIAGIADANYYANIARSACLPRSGR